MQGSNSPTFRVRRVPAFVDRVHLVQFLVSTVEGIGSSENLRIFSFAPSPGDWNKPSSQTATLQFVEVPARFSRSEGENEWPVAVPSQKLPLLFDVHFLDFTILNHVEAEVHDFDFIAISGLASHPFGSWRKHASTSTTDQRPWSFMWLRDQLPLDFPRARVMTYGYDTTLLNSSSFQTIDDLAQFLIAKLKAIGKAQTSTRPVVFLAHSLGGLILKRALCYLADSGAAEDFMLQQVRMVIFFGVPSRGMKMSYMLPMVNGQPNKQLVEALSDSPQNEYLSWLNSSFCGIALFRHIRLISAYETQLTTTFVELTPGKWERKGEQVVLVKRESAIQLGSQIPQDTFQIDRNHSDIVKFSEDDLSYSIVVNYLREAAESQMIYNSQASHFLRQASGIAGRASSLPFSMKTFFTKLVGTPSRAMQAHTPIPSLDGTATGQYTETLNLDQPGTMLDTQIPEAATVQVEQNMHDKIQQVTHSLDFQERHDRLEQIETAHKGTLDWFLERHTDLSAWLDNNNAGLYWIRGKAGSGKSTLMKSLHQSMSEKLTGEEDTSDSTKMNIWFFFHERGSYLQKAFEGLLRATIVEMIRKEVRLAEMAAKFYFTKARKKRDIWTLEDLHRIFSIFLEQDVVNINATLFIDALDEFSGFPEVVADFLATVALRPPATARTRIKICFSSRPWAAFLELFDTCPGFRLEDYTREDIRTYSKSRLCEIGSIADALSEDSQSSDEDKKHAQSMIDSITARAEGVFLWVRLVIDRLIADGAVSLERLEATLVKLPDQLEDYYAITLDRIPLHDRLASFIILEIVFRSRVTLHLRTLFSILSCAEADNFQECQTILHRYRISQPSFEQMALQLKNFCGGLLELLPTGHRKLDQVDGASDPLIQFIHRTVKDYIGQPGFKQRMLNSGHAKLSENGYCFIMKYKFGSPTDVDGLIETCNLAETSTGIHIGGFLDTVPDSFFMQVEERRGLFDSRLSFAVVADLRLYIGARIAASSPKLLVNSNGKRSLLHWAVQCTRGIPDESTWPNLAEMVSLLLQSGAKLDAVYDDMTPFETLFSECFEGFGGGGGSIISQRMIDVADVFLKAGQNVNLQLNSTYLGRKSGKKNFRCSPLHVSHGDMTRVLLDHGANVNALDSKGLTPLDICLGAVGNIFEIGDHRSPAEALQTTTLLVTRGGCLSEDGYSHFFEKFDGYCAKYLRTRYPEFVSMAERAPVLKKVGQRFRFANISKKLGNSV